MQPAEGEARPARPASHLARGAAEAKLLARASISSVAATAVDGVAYQAVLSLRPGAYVIAAALGAVLGALTNFLLNRYWAFPPTSRKIGTQAGLYVLASFTTYVVLQLALFVLVEMLSVNERLAWLPAKGFAWLLVSYPMQRFVVFNQRGTRGESS